MIIGAQLYTLHEFTKTLDDFAETLKKVADIGYTSVQVSATCGYTAEWLADQLKQNGLTCQLTHFNFNRILNDTENVIKEHKHFGCDHIGIGSMPGWDEGYPAFVSNPLIRPAMDKIHEAGQIFMYHNHDWEYETLLDDGRSIMQHLADDFTPDQLGFTLDTYWVKFGGGNLDEEIDRLAGRLPVVHFKDMYIDEAGNRSMSWVGGGNVFNFEKLAEKFDSVGTKYAYVEQDDCHGEDPFECLRKSYNYLKSIGLN